VHETQHHTTIICGFSLPSLVQSILVFSLKFHLSIHKILTGSVVKRAQTRSRGGI
jgi:hypothetical protein